MINSWLGKRARAIGGLLLCWLSLGAQAAPPLVAAASDLKFALEEVAREFTASSGETVRLVFGSSGNFYRQIRQGAPFDIYLSADESYVQRLEEAGFTRGQSFIYGQGRLVYFAPTGSVLDPQQGMDNLGQALEQGRLKRFAIANPDHAPYGRAALGALQSLQLAEAIKDKLILGENVSQAAQFALSGSTDGGLFAYSLALSEQVSARGNYRLVPQALHPPLIQRATLLKGAGKEAESFYAYLQSEGAAAVFERYGFGR